MAVAAMQGADHNQEQFPGETWLIVGSATAALGF